jgi:hypothetical protein
MLPIIADFLFTEKKLAVASISGYRSLLSTTLLEISGVELTDNRLLPFINS